MHIIALSVFEFISFQIYDENIFKYVFCSVSLPCTTCLWTQDNKDSIPELLPFLSLFFFLCLSSLSDNYT